MRSKQTNTHMMLALAFLVLLPVVTLGSFVLEVAQNDEACFVIRLPPERRSIVSGYFDVLDDNLSSDPVRVVVLDDKLNQIWKSTPSSSEGTFSFVQSPGRLSLCVQNGNKADRSVGLDVRVTSTDATNGLTHKAMLIQTELFNLKTHQAYMRAREAAHRDVTERTFAYVVRWNIVEGITLVIISCVQVLYLRKFFEQRRYM